jgi:hypothetical protein
MGVGVYEINHPQWKEEGKGEREEKKHQSKTQKTKPHPKIHSYCTDKTVK